MTRDARSDVRVEVHRSGRLESVHQVDVAVVDADGRVVASAGDPDGVVFARSAVKPFQALPLVQDGVADRFDLTEPELALCCASHSGEPRHVEVARSILARAGVEETALACGPHPPFSGSASRALMAAGEEPGRVHNNCSGKHGGMLALATAHGWPTEGYQQEGHPVQRRILEEIERWTGVDAGDIPTGVDGCGVVTFALPLTALALAFARLVRAAEAGSSPAGRVLGAMRREPWMVGGTNRLCTTLIETTGGRVVAKVGAEGVYGAAVRDHGWGIALKVRDGARRAAEVALLGVLEGLELLRPAEVRALENRLRPAVTNTRGEVVGGIRPVLEWSHGE